MAQLRTVASFAEAGDKAQAELDRMVDMGWALRKDAWHDVEAAVGKASLTKMACVVKMKQGKVEKVRIIVDMTEDQVSTVRCMCSNASYSPGCRTWLRV